jgi:hypothetical protein
MTMKRHYGYSLLLLILPLFMSVTGCTEDTTPTNPDNPDTGTPVGTPTEPPGMRDSIRFDVQWSPNAHLLDTNDVKTYAQSIDTATFVYTFRKGSAKIDGLKNGDVLVVGDIALRKVKSVTDNGATLTVRTDPAYITDAIVNGDISWDYGVRYDVKTVTSAFRKMGARPTFIGSDTAGYQIKIGDLEYNFGMKFHPDWLKADIRVLKKKGNTKILDNRLEGVLYKFRALGKVTIKDRKLIDFDARNDYVAGDLTLSLNAAGSGTNLGIESDFTLLKYPIPQIPFFSIKIKALVVMNGVIPPEGSCLMKARFRYDVDQGFSWSTGGALPKMLVRKEEFEKTGSEPRTGAASAASLSFGLGFPRVELEFLNTRIAWIQPAYLLGGDYTAMPACQQAKAQFIGSAGYGIGAFGISLASGSKTLWQKEKVLLKAGQCP